MSERDSKTTPRCPRCGEPATHAAPLIRSGGRRELWCANAHAWLWTDPEADALSGQEGA